MQVKKLFQYRNKVFLTWIATNILIFMIPIIIGECVYYNSISVVQHEVETVHQASLQQIKILVDGKIEELKKISSTLSIDSNIKTLAYSGYLYSPKTIYTMVEIQNDLKKYIVSNSFIENIYLYFNESKSLLAANDIYNGSELKSTVEDNFMTNIENWQNQINTVNPGNVRIFKKKSGTEPQNAIVFFQSVSANIYSQTPEVTLMVVMNNEKLKGLLSKLDTASKGNIFIVDRQNEYLELSGSYRFTPSLVNYNSLKLSKNIFTLMYKDQDSTIIHVGSEITNLQYILSMPSSVFADKVRYINTIIYVYIGVCLVFGLIIIYLVTKKNYYPLMRLTKILSNDTFISQKSELNEYKVIENAVNCLINDKKDAEKRIKQQNIPLRKNFLMRILKGRIKNPIQIATLNEQYKIHFESNNFIVMAFDVENAGDLTIEDGKEADDENDDLIYFVIQNIIEELVSDNYIVYFTEIDGLNVCLVNCKTSLSDSEDPSPVLNVISDAAQHTINIIKEHFKIDISVAVSSIKNEAEEIHSAYTEVLEIIEYKRLLEKTNVVIQYGVIEQNGEDELESINTMKSEIQFMNYLLDNDFKNASLMLDSIMESYLPSNATNFQVVKCRMFGLINIMLNALGEFKSKADVDYFNQLDPMKRMINSKSGTELKKEIRVIFKSIIDYYNNNESNETQDKVDEILEYIKHHYFDPNLNVSTIAMQYEINASYLCRIFKKRTKNSLLDYIHKCRIENAKLMLGTGLNIAEISEKVGYSSSMAMIRTFKKYEGITPGKYRELINLKE